MADDVAITAGAGTAIATDDCSGRHAQLFKLAISANGDATLIPADATKGLAVEPRPTADWIKVDAAGLTTATTLYTNGDVLGSELSFANAVRASGGTGEVIGARLIARTPSVLIGPVDLLLFDSASTPAANNVAESWADADMERYIATLTFGTPRNSALNAYSMPAGGLPILIEPAATTLYGVMVTRSTHTVHFGSATDIQVALGILKH